MNDSEGKTCGTIRISAYGAPGSAARLLVHAIPRDRRQNVSRVADHGRAFFTSTTAFRRVCDVRHAKPSSASILPGGEVRQNTRHRVETREPRDSSVGKVSKTGASEEIWHLGIEDLLMPSVAPAPAAVQGPFVINLRTSSTRIGEISKALRRFAQLHVYQLERRERGRPQYLLRAGIIETELEADAILATLREDYPGACKESAADDDRSAVAARAPLVASGRSAKKAEPGHAEARPADRPESRRATALPARRRAPATPSARAADSAGAFRWNIDEVLPDLSAPGSSISRRQPQTPTAARPRRAVTPPARPPIPAKPAHPPAQSRTPAPAALPPARGPLTSPSADSELDCDPNAVTDQVEAPVLIFQATIAANAQPPPAPAEAAMIELPSAAPQPPTDAPAPADAALPAKTAVATDSGVSPSTSAAPSDAPQLDSTQSIRALGSLEPTDGQASGWFAIQLMLSEEEIDPSDVPNLSIFAEYRLYALTGLDQDRLVHALRLGFFSSESAAAAVAGYLATAFDAPSIKRVSIEEHERFEERRVAARKDVGETEGHAVIELTAPAPSPLSQTGGKLPAADQRKAPEASSIWSRLIPTRKR